ncbi:MAG: SDR family oxidoreductase [Clostridiales bacterium]|nr:SDR family oxidoreductase [Clostridiales bacterium]
MRNILITGASRGIGAAAVRELSKSGRVFFTYKNSEEEAKKLCEETGAIAIQADITKAHDEILKTIRKYGGADVLVNNAGISGQSLFQDISDEDLDIMMNTNFRGMFTITRDIVPDMIRKKKGKIINISSMWGISGASCEVHYSASKAAVAGFTKALAKELGPSGICVNCIAPGVIDTDMNKCHSEETIKELKEETPLMRLGRAQEVAWLIEFLASEKSDFITGQIIGIDGGFIL